MTKFSMALQLYFKVTSMALQQRRKRKKKRCFYPHRSRESVCLPYAGFQKLDPGMSVLYSPRLIWRSLQLRSCAWPLVTTRKTIITKLTDQRPVTGLEHLTAASIAYKSITLVTALIFSLASWWATCPCFRNTFFFTWKKGPHFYFHVFRVKYIKFLNQYCD